MTTLAVAADKAPDRRMWIAAAAVLVLGAAAFGLAFGTEVSAALAVWSTSTAYNHCYLIVPISAYLVWERRSALVARLPEPTFLPVAAMIPVGLVWLLASQAGIMEGRQLAAMSLFELFVLAVLGFRSWRVIAFALLYLYFLVPFGAFLTPILQDFSARFAVRGLQILGIPVFFDPTGEAIPGLQVREAGAQVIQVPGATFDVVEACAGLRFLIASVALGTLYGYMMYRSWSRRAAFMAVSIVVPIIANGFRVLGIVVLGYILGDAEAAAADHLIYGWVFFSFVSLILILLGLPFRQPMAAFPVAASESPPSRRSQIAAAAVGATSVLLVAVLVSPVVTHGPVASTMGSVSTALKHALGR